MRTALEPLQQRDYQDRVVDKSVGFFEADDNSVLIESPTGCHRAGQGILMFDGSAKPVEQVAVGDRIVGPDGAVKTVIRLCRGRGRMVEIAPVKGSTWVVNEDHVLTLVRTNNKGMKKYPRTRRDCRDGEVLDVSVREWLGWSRTQKHLYKLFRVGVDRFGGAKRCLPIRPYHLGLLLGDGGMKHTTVDLTTSDPEIASSAEEIARAFGLQMRQYPHPVGKSVSYVFTSGRRDAANPLKEALTELGLRYDARHGAGAGDKFVPERYKTASVADRLAILAGLLDTDGHLAGGCYDHVTKSPRLARDMVFLARSVGLAAYAATCTKKSQNGTEGVYYRVSISGHIDRIPCHLPRKQASPRRQKKDATRTGFSVRPLGTERYYGFTLTGDGRYLLDDFTVTHNSGKTIMGLRICQCLAELYGWRTNWVSMRRNLLRQVADANARFFGLEGLTLVSMFEKDPPQAEITVVDEAQHDAAASCAHIHARSGSRVILGLSATPYRTDRLKLAFRRVVRDASIHRLITEGWLAPFEHWSVDDWDVPHVASVYLRERDKWGKSVAFFHRVEQCLEFAAILAGAGRHCEVVTADTDRERQLDDFESGRFDVVANVGILNEGFDCPPLRTVFVRDASKLPTIQMAGRAFRLDPVTGKTHCNVVQSGHARWQFTRTARPRQSHALRGGRWVTLGNSVRIDEVARESMGRIAAIEVRMPKYLSAEAQKKRHGAARGRGRCRRFQREPNLVGD